MSSLPKQSIVVMGDVHGEFGRLNSWINKKRPSLILQCGDFGYWPNWPDRKRDGSFRPLPKLKDSRLYFCDGNHEDHESLRVLDDCEVYPGVHYMRRGTVLTLPDDRTVLFMGGADSIDKHLRTPGKDWFPQELISESDICQLPEQRIDIVISHTCPREFKIPYLSDSEKSRDPSCMALSYVLTRYRPSLWYFGHWHFFGKGVYRSRGADQWECRWTCLDHIRGIGRWWTVLE